MTALTGISGDAPDARTLLRRSWSVTMPSPLGVRTSSAERFSASMSLAAWRAVSAGSQNSGALRSSDVTGRVAASGRERIVRAASRRRSRRLPATNRSPSRRVKTSSATSLGIT